MSISTVKTELTVSATKVQQCNSSVKTAVEVAVIKVSQPFSIIKTELPD